MAELGAYITQEYEILLRVFSFLPSKALANASKVCREWESVAKRLIMKRNKPFGHCKAKGTKWSEDVFDVSVQPKAVLRFLSCHGKKTSPEEFFPLLHHLYDLENVSVYDITNSYFIASDYLNNKIEVKGKLGKNDESVLLLCDMPGVTIKCTEIYEDAQIKERITSLMKREPKCMMLITSEPFTCMVDSLLTGLISEGSVKLVGGVAERPLKVYRQRTGELPQPGGLLLLSFHGENVEARLALEDLSQDLEDFIRTLSKEVGPVEKGAIRLVFMFTCINRLRLLKDREMKLFTKYFPDVPLYGLWSFGEYNYDSTAISGDAATSPPAVGRLYKRTNTWEWVESTSYLILTLKREA